MAASPDRWSRWLLERRDADDERQRQVVLEHLEVFREGVLALAAPERARFLARYGQTVAEGQPRRRSAVAYLAAGKRG